jgi:hypothetical protein
MTYICLILLIIAVDSRLSACRCGCAAVNLVFKHHGKQVQGAAAAWACTIHCNSARVAAAGSIQCCSTVTTSVHDQQNASAQVLQCRRVRGKPTLCTTVVHTLDPFVCSSTAPPGLQHMNLRSRQRNDNRYWTPINNASTCRLHTWCCMVTAW